MRGFSNRRTELDPGDSYVLGEFEQFINSSIGFPAYMKRAIPHLRKHWEPRGAKLHRVMRDFLWYVVPEELRVVSRPGFGLDYTGYYLSPSTEVNSPTNWIWYGFVNSKAVGSDVSDDEACFMLAAPFKLEGVDPDPSGALNRCENVNGWTDNGHDCWVLRIDDTWDRPEKWEKPLTPVFESVSAAFGISDKQSIREA